jgi:hypothetical protein
MTELFGTEPGDGKTATRLMSHVEECRYLLYGTYRWCLRFQKFSDAWNVSYSFWVTNATKLGNGRWCRSCVGFYYMKYVFDVFPFVGVLVRVCHRSRYCNVANAVAIKFKIAVIEATP